MFGCRVGFTIPMGKAREEHQVRIVGDDTANVEKHLTCGNCGKRLAFLPIDVKEMNTCDISGHREIEKYITCPACNNQIWL